MKISILLTTYNRQQLLTHTFPMLLGQDFPPQEYEIVVVVDGSTDGSAEWLRQCRPQCALTIIEQENKGQVAAQNVGLRACRGELLLLIDDEMTCGPTLVREHVAAHELPGGPFLVFGPTPLAAESPPTLASEWTRGWFGNFDVDSDSPPQGVWRDFIMLSPNTSLPRRLLVEAGGFDERCGFAHDLEAGLRMRAAGVKSRFQPTATAHQICVKSDTYIVRQDGPRQGLNFFYIGRKHPRWRPQSPLAALGRTWGVQRWMWSLAARLPFSTDPLLVPPFRAIDRLHRNGVLRRKGVALLEKRRWAAMLRALLRETGSWQALQQEFGMRLPVLVYHHIGPAAAGDGRWTISPKQFASDIAWLAAHGYHGIRSGDWLRWCTEGKPLPTKPVLLALDDAYADVAHHALPVVERHGFGATVFVVTDRVGTTNVWDAGREMGPHSLMSAGQIRDWARRGIEFGAHSCSHPDLTQLSPAELSREVSGSRSALEAITGQEILAFAYPYGRHNERVRQEVGKHFDLAFTLEQGINDLSTELTLLRRNCIRPGQSRFDFRWNLALGKNPLEGLRQRARRMVEVSTEHTNPLKVRL